jgi:hypothetical protein
MVDKEGMGRRVGIIMGGMRRAMGRRGNMWMIGGEGAVALWRQCWRVWPVVVVWMRVCYFKDTGWRNDTEMGDWRTEVVGSIK